MRLCEVKRICLSLITRGRVAPDALDILKRLQDELPAAPLSLLCSRTCLNRKDLEDLRGISVDRLGIAVDVATEDLFDRLRGDVP